MIMKELGHHDEVSEAHYLRRTSALPTIDGHEATGATFFNYFISRGHGEDGRDSLGSKVDGYDRWKPEDLEANNTTLLGATAKFFTTPDTPNTPNIVEFIKLAYFGNCSREVANGVIYTITGKEAPQWQQLIPSPKMTKDCATRLQFLEVAPQAPQGAAAEPDLEVAPQAPQSATAELKSSAGLENHKEFITGLSINAIFSPKVLVLMVAMPYLGHKGPHNIEQSLALPDYSLSEMGLPTNNGSSNINMRVYQAWFVIFDDFRIAVFKSGNDPASNRPPLFHYQPRLNAFHALVSMLSNVFTPSEESPIKLLRVSINKHLHTLLTVNEELDSYQRAKEEIGFLISSVDSCIDLVVQQLEILRNLERVFSGNQPLDKGCPYRNKMNLPFLTAPGGLSETLDEVVKSIRALISNRSRFKEELESWAMVSPSAVIQNQALQLSKEAIAMGDNITKLQTEALHVAKLQGETITWFTFITIFFIPFGAFASYYDIGPDNKEGAISSYREFWVRAGPPIFVVTLFAALFLVLPDILFRRHVRRLFGFPPEVKLQPRPQIPIHATPQTSSLRAAAAGLPKNIPPGP